MTAERDERALTASMAYSPPVRPKATLRGSRPRAYHCGRDKSSQRLGRTSCLSLSTTRGRSERMRSNRGSGRPRCCRSRCRSSRRDCSCCRTAHPRSPILTGCRADEPHCSVHAWLSEQVPWSAAGGNRRVDGRESSSQGVSRPGPPQADRGRPGQRPGTAAGRPASEFRRVITGPRRISRHMIRAR